MDQNKILNFKKILSEKSNILILLPQLTNTDTISAATTFFHFVTTSLKKNALIASINPIPQRFAHLLTLFGIEEKYLVSEINPLQYVIDIKDTEKDMEIGINRGDNNVEIVLIPKLKTIDLSKINLKTVGINFDLFVSFNINTLEDLGTIYTKSQHLFEKITHVSIGGNFAPAAAESIFNEKFSTASESLYAVLEGFGATLDQPSRDVLFEGIACGTDGLHRVQSKNATQTTLDLCSDANYAEKLSSIYYSYSPEGLELRKKIFANLNQEKNIVFSHITASDLVELGIKDVQLDGMDFLPFDIVDQVDTYILSYEHTGKNKVLIETADKNAFEKLKSQQFDVSRSSSLICVLTDKSTNAVINAMTGTVQLFDEEKIPASSNATQEPQKLIDAPVAQVSAANPTVNSAPAPFTPTTK